MTINDKFLQIGITELLSKLHDNGVERRNLRNCIECAQGIQLISVPDPTDDNIHNIKLVLPQDSELNKEITEERREEIFNTVISEAAQFNVTFTEGGEEVLSG